MLFNYHQNSNRRYRHLFDFMSELNRDFLKIFVLCTRACFTGDISMIAVGSSMHLLIYRRRWNKDKEKR